MNVFFTTPYKGKKTYQPFIDEIIRLIEESGAELTSPEKSSQYKTAIAQEIANDSPNKEKAHYEFIRKGIASSDALIFEATYEDFRVGHEATLGLLYGKPVLVLSQNENYSEYIYNEKFFGKKYSSKEELANIISEFLHQVDQHSKRESLQEVADVTDLQHSASLSKLRYRATQGDSYFSDWARRATKESDKVYGEILKKLGSLKIQNPWDVFAKIYNEDTPDKLFLSSAKFADKIFKQNKITSVDSIVDAACGTGSVSRNLVGLGYRQITAFDGSRAMLSEAYDLCSHLPNIKILEGKIESIMFEKPVSGIVWFDFSSNFAMDKNHLKAQLRNLTKGLRPGGILIFDVRTKIGWDIDFFKQKVTAYETESFQRLWINLPDYDARKITFDIFIRLKNKGGEWLPWEREQMTEKMWSANEVVKVVQGIPDLKLLSTFSDDYSLMNDKSDEPGLMYLVLQKSK